MKLLKPVLIVLFCITLVDSEVLYPYDHFDYSKAQVIQSLTGHTSYVKSLVKVSNDLIASAADDKTVILWKEENGKFKEFQTLTGHSAYVSCLLKMSEISIASGAGDNTIKLWKEQNGQFTEIQTLTGHTSAISSLLKVSDNIIASGSNDGAIKFWREENGEFKEIQTLTGHAKAVRSLLKMKEGAIASGSDDKTIKIWREEDGQFIEIQTLTGHGYPIYSLLKVSETVIASGSDDTIKLWKEENWQFKQIQSITVYTGPVYCLMKVSEDVIASGSYKNIKLWREENEQLTEIQTLAGHTDNIHSLLKISENTMASGSWDHTIKLWKFYDKHKERQIGNYKINLLGQSGKVTFSYSNNNTNFTGSSRIEIDFDSVIEKNASGMEIGKSALQKHSSKDFSQLTFEMSEFKELKFQNLHVTQSDLFIDNFLGSTKLTAYLSIFNETGSIDLGKNNKIDVSKGTLKFSVKIENWSFCSNNTNILSSSCMNNQTVEAGAFIDFAVRIKGNVAAELFESTINQYSFGNANIILPNTIRLDDKYADMPEGFPAFVSNNSTNLFKFRFPKFNSSVEYDFVVEIGKPVSGLITFLIVILAILGSIVVGLGVYCVRFKKKSDAFGFNMI